MSSFRGFTALLLSKHRLLTRLLVSIGLVAGVVTGFLARLGGREVEDALPVLSMFLLWMSAAIAPLIATGGDTFSGGQAGTRSRREELLALPIGRLALPAAQLVSSVAIALAFMAAVSFGFVVWFGVGPVASSFLSPVEGFDGREMPGALVRLGIAVLSFSACFALGASGAHRAIVNCLVAAPPLIVAGLSLGMGYTGKEAAAFAAFAGGFLTLFFLTLPFFLYARPAHHWSAVRGFNDRESVDLIALLVSLTAITTLGLFGALPASGVLLVGAAIVVRAWRGLPRTERSSVPHTRIVHALALLALAPPCVLGLAVDAKRFADGADPRGKHVRQYAVSPDGRALAAVLHSRDDPTHGLSRVVVADLDGKAPPLALRSRWAALEGPCWSADGRYLAVQETGVGRIAGRTLDDDLEAPRAVSCLFRRLHGTLVLDTKTGEIASLPLCRPTPGWSLPADLIRITAGVLGQDDLADGRGFAVSLRRGVRVSIEGCDSGGALLRIAGGEVQRLSASGLAPVGSSTVWIATASPEPAANPGEPAPASSVKLVRGTECVTIPHVVRELWTGTTSYLAETAAGIVRYELPGLAEKIILPAAELKIVIRTERTAYANRAVPPQFVLRTTRGYVVLDAATGSLRPLDVPAGFSPAVVVGTRVVGRGPDETLLVRDGDGPLRPVF